MSGSVSGGRVFPLCHLRLEALRQIEERLQANRKAAAEAGRGHGLIMRRIRIFENVK